MGKFVKLLIFAVLVLVGVHMWEAHQQKGEWRHRDQHYRGDEGRRDRMMGGNNNNNNDDGMNNDCTMMNNNNNDGMAMNSMTGSGMSATTAPVMSEEMPPMMGRDDQDENGGGAGFQGRYHHDNDRHHHWNGGHHHRRSGGLRWVKIGALFTIGIALGGIIGYRAAMRRMRGGWNEEGENRQCRWRKCGGRRDGNSDESNQVTVAAPSSPRADIVMTVPATVSVQPIRYGDTTTSV